MKKYIVTFIVAMIIGYVYGNFGNVSDFSMDYQPQSSSRDSFRTSYDYRGRDSDNSLDYRGRDSDNSLDYRGRIGDSSLDYRSRGSDNSLDYRSRDGAGGNDGGTSLDYRGRSSRTGRYVRR